MNDISDHLPVFATFQNHFKFKTETNTCKLVRHRTQEAINAFKADLMKQDWNDVYVDDPDKAYEAFLFIFTALYEKHCPLKGYRGKQKYAEKPWITKGLQNACKKKNTLYRNLYTT